MSQSLTKKPRSHTEIERNCAPDTHVNTSSKDHEIEQRGVRDASVNI
jgi:hypothetical protein